MFFTLYRMILKTVNHKDITLAMLSQTGSHLQHAVTIRAMLDIVNILGNILVA